jgi:hypothetical protein
MRSRLSIAVVGLSVSAVLAVTYGLAFLACALTDSLFPGTGMMSGTDMMAGVMQPMPGLGWSVVGFVIGLVLAVVGGFYIAVIYVPVYNYLQGRAERRDARATPTPSYAHG